ncbi:MAG: response regulator [Lachnospiraceae bacterium]|nr:response regulator [Lachnospiraceae bacterium]
MNSKDKTHAAKLNISMLKIAISIICILFNVLGSLASHYFQLPLKLDCLGTMLAAILLEPFMAGATGLISLLICGFLSFNVYSYSLVGAVIGFYCSLTYPREDHRMFKVIFCSGIVALVGYFISIPIFLFFNGGYVSNMWGDAAVDKMLHSGNSSFISCLTGAALIYLPDRIISLLAASQIGRFFKKRTLSAKQVVSATVALTVLLSTCAPVLTDAKDLSSDYAITEFSSLDGLPVKEVNSLVQTSDGYVWVGTYSGLYRCDGTKFSKAPLKTSVTSVMALKTYGTDELLIATNDKGLVSYNINTLEEKSYTTEDGLSSNSVRSIATDSAGRIYVGSSALLSIIDHGKITTTDTDSDLHQVENMSSNGSVVAGIAHNGNLFFMRDGVVLSKYRMESDDNTRLTAVCAMPDETFLVSDSAGYIYTVDDPEHVVLRKYTYINETIAVQRMIYDEFSDIVFVCGEIGFGYLDSFGHYSPCETSTFYNAITCAMRDMQGNIWFSSGKQGVILYSDNPFTSVLSTSLNNGSPVNTVTEYNGKLFIGFDEGIFVVDKKTYEEVPFIYSDRFENVKVRQIYKDSRDNLWFSTYGDDGLVCVTLTGDYLTFTTKNGASDDCFREVLELRDGSIVAADRSGGLTFIENYKVTNTIAENEKTITSAILTMVQAQDGSIYCGSDGNGIIVIKYGKVIRHITEADGLNSMVILRIVPYGDDLFYVTSDGIYYDDGENIRLLDNFPYSNNYDIYLSPDGEAWITSSAGLYIVNAKSLAQNSNYSARLLNENSGLDTALSAISWNYVDENGTMFLCTSTDVYAISIPDYGQTVVNFELAIESIKADDVILTPSYNGRYIIPQGTEQLIINPAVLNFTLYNPTIRMYLEGYESSGTTLTQDNISDIKYTNLPYGKYIFHIQVIDPSDGSVLREKTFTLFKEALFYETPVFNIYFTVMFTVLIVFYTWIFAKYGSSLIISRQYEEIKKAKDEADEANDLKSRFLATVTHEIRTPINAIIGMDEVLIRETDDAQTKEQAYGIMSAANSLLSIVNDVLDISKIESGKMDISHEEYDTAELFTEVITMFREMAATHSLEAKISISPDIPSRLIGDHLRLRQVMLNLLSNAVKYTPEGSVSFSASCNYTAKDEIVLSVSVRDTGTGIEEEDMGKLFENFERVGNARKNGIQGTGLGLSITKQLLELMGGQIFVESKYGEGSAFSFVLPQKVAGFDTIGPLSLKSVYKPAELGEIIYAPTADILIVDDSDMNLNVFRELLAPTAICIDTASSGVDALLMIAKKHYDIIFLDHIMPEMDGLETLDAIKNSSHKCIGVPIIALTANAGTGAKNTYITAGFKDYLAKPVRFSDFQQMLMEYLPKRKYSMKASGSIPAANKPPRSMTKLDRLGELLDTQSGLSYCADDEQFYYSMIDMYTEQFEEKRDGLLKAYDEKEFYDYIAISHSIKSMSKTVGATALYEEALAHEKAGKEHDTAFMDENLDGFLRRYEELIIKLRTIK